MKNIFIIPFLIISIFSCNQEKEINISNLKYLALGDSYTIGEGINFDVSYPKQIVNEISFMKLFESFALIGFAIFAPTE